MKPVGVKSCLVLFLFLALTGYAMKMNIFGKEALQALSAEAALWIGALPVLMATWIFYFGRFDKSSLSYIRFSNRTVWDEEQPILHAGRWQLLIGKAANQEVLELPRIILRVLLLGICLDIALFCFNKHSIELMAATPGRIMTAGLQYCPQEKPEEEVEKKVKPGCELIKRAYELGYVQKLGACAPEEDKGKPQLCTFRQYDEPYVHYFLRRLRSDMASALHKYSDENFFDRMVLVFKKQMEKFSPLLSKQSYVVKNAPKSTHHIFTNLPYPNGYMADALKQLVSPNDCIAKYKKLPHTISNKKNDSNFSSRALDHVIGQMLFNSKYEKSVGDCREYKIHWSSSLDSCKQLTSNPDGFLRSESLKSEVDSVFERFHDREELIQLFHDIDALMGKSVEPPVTARRTEIGDLKPRTQIQPQSVISFQCFMVDGKTTASTSVQRKFKLGTRDFNVTDTTVPLEPVPHKAFIQIYKNLSSTMADFSYTGYSSHQNVVTANQWQIDAEEFKRTKYSFSQLEYLKFVDIFLGNEWLADREDLLQVYPYYYHLYHFVQLFRQSYLMQRTHL